MSDFSIREMLVMQQTLQEKYKDKNILLVTHGGTCRAINAYFNGIDEDGYVQSVKINNCEIKEYEYK